MNSTSFYRCTKTQHQQQTFSQALSAGFHDLGSELEMKMKSNRFELETGQFRHLHKSCWPCCHRYRCNSFSFMISGSGNLFLKLLAPRAFKREESYKMWHSDKWMGIDDGLAIEALNPRVALSLHRFESETYSLTKKLKPPYSFLPSKPQISLAGTTL